MSLMSKFFNNTRKPEGFLGKMMISGMNGNMDVFVQTLYGMGYEKVELISTTDGKFMSSKESQLMFLKESKPLVGKK